MNFMKKMGRRAVILAMMGQVMGTTTGWSVYPGDVSVFPSSGKTENFNPIFYDVSPAEGRGALRDSQPSQEEGKKIAETLKDIWNRGSYLRISDGPFTYTGLGLTFLSCMGTIAAKHFMESMGYNKKKFKPVLFGCVGAIIVSGLGTLITQTWEISKRNKAIHRDVKKLLKNYNNSPYFSYLKEFQDYARRRNSFFSTILHDVYFYYKVSGLLEKIENI